MENLIAHINNFSASAGDIILDPAIQLPAAARTTSARTREIVKIRFLLIMPLFSATKLGNLG